MIYGVGTDIFKMSQLTPVLDDGSFDDPFFHKAFTERERKLAFYRYDPAAYFATHFSGKEAVFKAISKSGCDFIAREIEIIEGQDGRPEVFLHGNTAAILQSISGEVNIHLSLSYDTEYATANAVAEITGRRE